MAHPVVGRERVGAGVGDEAVRVEPDQAVARARARVGARDGRAAAGTCRRRPSGRGPRRCRGRRSPAGWARGASRGSCRGRAPPRTAPSWRTGIVSRRTGTSRCQRGSSSRQIRPSTTARRSCGLRPGGDARADDVLGVRGRRRWWGGPGPRRGTRAAGVLVLTGAGSRAGSRRTTCRPAAATRRPPAAGARRCRRAARVCSASSSLSVDTSRPPPRRVARHPTTCRPRPQTAPSRGGREEHHVEAGTQAARPQQEGRQPRQEAQHLIPDVTQRPGGAGSAPSARRRVVRTSTWCAWCRRRLGHGDLACSSTATRICSRRRFFSPSGACSPPHFVASSLLSFSSRPYSARHGAHSSRWLRQQRPPLAVALVVEEQPHLGEHLGAVGLVRLPAAHDAASDPSLVPAQ